MTPFAHADRNRDGSARGAPGTRGVTGAHDPGAGAATEAGRGARPARRSDPAGRSPVEFDDAVTWAAWLYYADQLTQSEIAKHLGVSRASVVNYLQEARERGLVSININPALSGRISAGRALARRYGLKAALVIPSGPSDELTERLGDAGARVLESLLRSGDTIGVAWGRTVLAAARCISLAHPVPGLTVVQVSGSSIGARSFSPELCTSLLSSRIDARCVNLLAPAVLSTRELRAMLLAEPVLREQMQLVHSTDHILFGAGDVGADSTVRASGIGSPQEMDDYVARGAAAVIIGRFIDARGRPVGGDHDARMVGISLEELRKVGNRICVSGGPMKVEALRATLAGAYPTHLVTDLDTASALLADEGEAGTPASPAPEPDAGRRENSA